MIINKKSTFIDVFNLLANDENGSGKVLNS